MMKRCHVINKQEENYWAELYSAKLQGREEGRKEGIEKGKVMMIERLIEDNLYTIEQISKISEIPLHQIEEIKANMEHAIP
ncbi:hypothetical protein GCM10027566_00390 [Arachidicoccus ginsenosidivorans]|uniref:Rpn family recombination-promoting nuclease/putative transposase n=1 Tax=Arachidicoccus ginsenosidivorans TaxID=496057 RepID=A0A5B8VTB1_9BACT|nr:hypothetical protein [Arachidicoccus ginsenosidivorans]QEC73815.1 hypothetical protein FSB73_21255 [Arachidicoccus ginsenosidivorans]